MPNLTDYKDAMSNKNTGWVITAFDSSDSAICLGVQFGTVQHLAFLNARNFPYMVEFNFRLATPQEIHAVIAGGVNRVDISLAIDSQTWSMEPEDRVKFFSRMLKGTPSTDFIVEESERYGAVRLTRDPKAKLIASALAKLTPEEKIALLGT